MLAVLVMQFMLYNWLSTEFRHVVDMFSKTWPASRRAATITGLYGAILSGHDGPVQGDGIPAPRGTVPSDN